MFVAFLQAYSDMFAWTPSYMSGVPQGGDRAPPRNVTLGTSGETEDPSLSSGEAELHCLGSRETQAGQDHTRSRPPHLDR
jgi:hypothetical protein